MKHLSIMIKPASSLCNLRCKYCFYEDVAENRTVPSLGIMSIDTMKAVIDSIFDSLSDKDELTLAFQGGEPTMAGLEFFEKLSEYVDSKLKEKRVRLSYAIQTNATTLTKEWCEYFSKYHYLVGVSLDLHRGCHDSLRLDAGGNGTFDRVLSGIELLRAENVEFNVLCTLTESLAQYPRKVWDMIVKNNFEYVQFTPCLGELGSKTPYELSPKRFAEFYKDIFDRWYVDLLNGKGRSVKLFDDIANLFLYGTRTACGINGKCSPQIIVEADGSVYPCDFYCLDQYRLGNLASENLLLLYKKSEESESKKREPLPKMCSQCRYLVNCGGGCKRMRSSVCFTDENKEYCGYRELLDYTLDRINMLQS